MAHLCKKRKLVRNTRVGLATMCEVVLRCKLPKPIDVRISDWSRRKLSTEHFEYAALDAWVSLKIFEKLMDESVKTGIRPVAAIPGQLVGVFSNTSDDPCALGAFVSQEESNECIQRLIEGYRKEAIMEAIDIRSYVVVVITHTLAPAMLMPHYSCGEESITLQDLGPPPFSLVVSLNNLKKLVVSEVIPLMANRQHITQGSPSFTSSS